MSSRSSACGSWLAVTSLLSFAACGGDQGLSGPGGDDDGDDLRPGLTVIVQAEQGAAGNALGWTSGIPNAEVRIHRIGTDFAWQTAITDANGVARFPAAISGRYRVAGYRILNGAERAIVPDAELAFGGGVVASVTDGRELTLGLGPTRPRGLVISEVYATAPFVAETTYDYHYYFEVYNNSDQVRYLDGLLFGSTLGVPTWDLPDISCAVSDPWRNDPRGLWVQFIMRFPGGGAEYPLAPGEAAVVALDAIDHSGIRPDFPDLSDADFELLGSADVDNPAVPNLVDVGLGSFPAGHGLRFFINETLFIADALDPATFERATQSYPGNDFEVLLVPTTGLLDVVATREDDALTDQQYPPCYPRTNEAFDRLAGGFIQHGVDVDLSVQRITIATINGRAILQDTNTSAIDLVGRPHTPGTIP